MWIKAVLATTLAWFVAKKTGLSNKVASKISEIADNVAIIIGWTVYWIGSWDIENDIISIKWWLEKNLTTMDDVKKSLAACILEDDWVISDKNEEDYAIEKVASFKKIDKETNLKDIYKNSSWDYIFNLIEWKYQIVLIYFWSSEKCLYYKEWSEVANAFTNNLFNK